MLAQAGAKNIVDSVSRRLYTQLKYNEYDKDDNDTEAFVERKGFVRRRRELESI